MKRLFLLSLVVLFCPAVMFAQQTITLNDAIRTAISNNTTLSSIENNLRIQEFNIRNARGDLFPSLSLSGNWSRTNNFSKGGVNFVNGVPINVSSQDRTSNNFSMTMNSNVTLYNGFANFDLVDLERENRTVLQYDFQNQKNDVVIQVNRNFFEVLKREQIVSANEQNLAESQAQLEAIREFFNVGRKTITDIYKQDVQVAQNELALEQSRNDYAKAKVDLLVSMNEDLNRNIAAAGEGINPDMSSEELRVVLEGSQNVDVLVNRAVQNRYDYKSVIKQIEVNRLRLDIAEKNLYFPTISAFGQYNINGNAIDEITNNRTASYGISFSYPIFQGFNLDVNRQIAEVNIMQTTLQLEQLDLQVKSDIKKAVLDLQTAYKQAEILDRSIRSAEQDRTFSEENYRLGLGTLLDVQTATTRLNQLRIDKINAVYNFLIAKRTLDYYTGQLNY